jgi:dimethylargininase
MRAFRKLSFIEPPGTLDGGDVLCLGRSLFVGVSGRTNHAAVDQMRAVLAPFGYTVSAVSTTGCLHLKTAATPVADRTILVNPAWVDPNVFGPVAVIAVDPSEPFAANALRVGKTVVHSAAYPRTRARLEEQGLGVRPLDLSELARAEGGLTCCSLLFPMQEGGGDRRNESRA